MLRVGATAVNVGSVGAVIPSKVGSTAVITTGVGSVTATQSGAGVYVRSGLVGGSYVPRVGAVAENAIGVFVSGSAHASIESTVVRAASEAGV